MNRLHLLLATIGAAALAGKSHPADPDAKAMPRPLVVVVDGAGDLKGCSTAMARLKQIDQLPIDLEVFPWSHGHYQIYKDQVDDKYSRLKGKELAERLLDLKKQRPERPLILVSYSAGCAVGLAAGNQLPADTLERHIVLCPSVSTHYDLRTSLRAARQGLDVFCSKKDRWALGLAVRWVGTADSLHEKEAAGRHGFQPIVEKPGDRELYQRLRHQFWMPEDAKLGHDGRHHGIHAPAYLQQHIAPLLRIDR